MIITRRQAMGGGGAFLAAFALAPSRAAAGGPVEIRMQGSDSGSHVWFDPIGVHIQPGQTVRWINLDPGNSHTVTAYHPSLFDRPRRIPRTAKPWDSDYLLEGESFSITLRVPGIYDVYCIPHEHAGMVGRIVVGNAKTADWMKDKSTRKGLEPLPEVALNAFPPVEDIVRDGMVRRTA